MNKQPVEGDLQVWWVPQVPMPSFTVPVKGIEQAMFLLDTLANYDIFQFDNNVKGDYCNAGGLNIWESGEWCEWENEDGETIDDLRRNRDDVA